jgi:hypothetical protein
LSTSETEDCILWKLYSSLVNAGQRTEINRLCQPATSFPNTSVMDKTVQHLTIRSRVNKDQQMHRKYQCISTLSHSYMFRRIRGAIFREFSTSLLNCCPMSRKRNGIGAVYVVCSKVWDLNISCINQSSTGNVHHCSCGRDVSAHAWFFFPPIESVSRRQSIDDCVRVVNARRTVNYCKTTELLEQRYCTKFYTVCVVGCYWSKDPNICSRVTLVKLVKKSPPPFLIGPKVSLPSSSSTACHWTYPQPDGTSSYPPIQFL